VSKPASPIKVFYSYAHLDESAREQLEKQLSILQRTCLIRGWHDRKIVAGAAWKDAIDEELEKAEIILLLVSANFLASDYCSLAECGAGHSCSG
jgi:hypothetical protein